MASENYMHGGGPGERLPASDISALGFKYTLIDTDDDARKAGGTRCCAVQPG